MLGLLVLLLCRMGHLRFVLGENLMGGGELKGGGGRCFLLYFEIY